jgi:eukaryotic-like serine/threonine-protein kinase
MIRCRACSQDNPDNAVFCSRCGADLPRAGGTVPDAPTPDAFDRDPPSALGPTNPAHVDAGGHLANGILAPGVVVDGKYEVLSVLGEGGMGIVYLAHDVHTDARVVIKAMHGELAHNPDYRDRVKAEARALARIDHPNVVRLNAVVAERDVLLLVMQYVDGQSLDRRITTYQAMNVPFPLDEAFNIFRQVVAGVGAAHREGVVHRDIKPGNVLLRDKDGVAKVTDFGIAKDEAEALAGRGKTQGIIGSLWYMAPEQITGQRTIDKRVDIYALGILFFEMLVGRVPFDAQSDYEIMKLHTEAPFPSVHALRLDAPPELDALLARACAKDKQDRFASADELLGAFDAAVGFVPPASQVAPRGPMSRVLPPASSSGSSDTSSTGSVSVPAGKSPAGWILGTVALAAIAVGSFFFFYQPTPGVTGPAASTGSTTGPAASVAPVDDPLRELRGLEGKWLSDTGRHYDAVLVGDALEFQIRDPEELPRQGYQAGEPRFTLRKKGGTLMVEDKIRPTPPTGFTYDPRARGTCQEVWTEVKGAPLMAQARGNKLGVDLAKITPDRSVFETSGQKVVGCRKFAGTEVEKVESTLTREP